MKKFPSSALFVSAFLTALLPSAFVHAAATTTPKFLHTIHPAYIPTNQSISSKTFLKPSAALHVFGTLTATTASSISITETLGRSNASSTPKTYTTDSSIKFLKGGASVTLDKLTIGDLVQIDLSQPTKNTFVVRTVTDTGLGLAFADIKANAKTNANRVIAFKAKLQSK